MGEREVIGSLPLPPQPFPDTAGRFPAKVDILTPPDLVIAPGGSFKVTAKITATDGLPIGAGYSVGFSTSDGSFPGVPTTGSDGVATSFWTIAQRLGPQTATVTAGEVSALLRAIAVAPAALIKSGDAQTGKVGELLSQSICVRVVDATGRFVGGVLAPAFTFSVTAGGGSLTETRTGEGSDPQQAGFACTGWRLGSVAGSQTVSATLAGVPSVVFSATAQP